VSILTASEVAELRAKVAERSPVVAGGFTWTAIEALCDTVDFLRQVIIERDRVLALARNGYNGRI